jgi:hypothetical protein
MHFLALFGFLSSGKKMVAYPVAAIKGGVRAVDHSSFHPAAFFTTRRAGLEPGPIITDACCYAQQRPQLYPRLTSVVTGSGVHRDDR